MFVEVRWTAKIFSTGCAFEPLSHLRVSLDMLLQIVSSGKGLFAEVARKLSVMFPYTCGRLKTIIDVDKCHIFQKLRGLMLNYYPEY